MVYLHGQRGKLKQCGKKSDKGVHFFAILYSRSLWAAFVQNRFPTNGHGVAKAKLPPSRPALGKK